MKVLLAAIIAVCALVASSQRGDADVLRVPEQYETLAAAVSSAAGGDTIEVSAGVYSGELNRNIDPEGRDLVFIAPDGSSATIIDCEDAGRAFHFQSGETAATVVRGFTIRDGNGYATQHRRGGAVRCVNSAPSFYDCVFLDCWGEFGGAIHGYSAAPAVVGCQFVGNLAAAGGAMTLWECAGVHISHCVFVGNRGSGAALEIEFSSVDIEWCDFLANRASNYASAISMWGVPSPRIANCTFLGNWPWPVLSCNGGSLADVTRVIIAFNQASAMSCWNSTPRIEHSVSYGNTGGDSLCGHVGECLYTDPALCKSSPDDATLCADSPCLPENNEWTLLIGAHGAGCGPCVTAAEYSSWGALKAFYR